MLTLIIIYKFEFEDIAFAPMPVWYELLGVAGKLSFNNFRAQREKYVERRRNAQRLKRAFKTSTTYEQTDDEWFEKFKKKQVHKLREYYTYTFRS